MTEQDQINALAELDGLGEQYSNEKKWKNAFNGTILITSSIPDYLHSYDAIIPLIHKIAHQSVLHEILWISTTPAQLCESLLRATGKWKE